MKKMARTYHADMAETPKQAPVTDTSTPSVSLEMAADNAGIVLRRGVRNLKNRENEKQPFKQPFWFAYEMGESVGVYLEAPGEEYRTDSGELRMLFDSAAAKEDLRAMLINYSATSRAMDISFTEFAGRRGFTIKRAKR